MIIHSLLSILMVVFFIMITLRLIDKKYELGFKVRQGIIIDRSVISVTIISACCIFFETYFRFSRYSTVELVLNIILIWGLSVLTITDYKKKLVPNKVLLVLFLLWAVVISIFSLMDIGNSLTLIMDTAVGGGIAGLLFFVSYLLSKGQLGAGDVKLAFLMGLYLMSTRALLAFLIGTTLCFIYSFTMVIFKKLTLKDQVPLVPFLAMGAFIVILLA